MLRVNQNFPVSIQEKVRVGSREINIEKKVTSKDLAFFCRQLHAMLTAGSTVLRCLDIMKQQLDHKVLRATVGQMHTDVQKGKVLSKAMADHPKVFPNLMVFMVESGELSGTLDDILERLAVYFEKDYKLKNKVKSAMVYPIVLVVLSIVVVNFLVLFIMPTFVGMFESSGVELPGTTKFLLGVSRFFFNNIGIIFIGIFLVLVLIVRFIASDAGRLFIDRIKLKIPVVKELNVKIMTARFSRNLSTMLSSGVPLLTALENISRIIGNKVVENMLQEYREEIQKGTELHVAVKNSHFFPPMLDNMMEIGKESGTLDNILGKTADYYDEEVEQALQRLVTLFEPMMILVLGVVIGFIVISMYMPLFDLAQTI
ncbi:type II secretion system F family protein [Anaerotalea alkaliphila]|uniref:Type II secretion system F family protein n=1 Tax=Anaerotalea alkaliphila TaxID=2662126 RepID=A0A7X5HXD1_9FIRM|nr:type II secretion system F family protein [Anaerotalea alkaliphila]NDL68231.1 type II secretion system F family protein [Anaerotalea alkaliphila]